MDLEIQRRSYEEIESRHAEGLSLCLSNYDQEKDDDDNDNDDASKESRQSDLLSCCSYRLYQPALAVLLPSAGRS